MAIREVNDKWIEVTQDPGRRVQGTMTLQLRKYEEMHDLSELVVVSDPWRRDESREVLVFPLTPLIEALQKLKDLDNG